MSWCRSPRPTTRKAAIADRIRRDRTLDRGTREQALRLLRLADDNGVIYNDALYALALEMDAEAGEEVTHGR
jgi:hypothetical protein